jgi:hypothetical protein
VLCPADRDDARCDDLDRGGAEGKPERYFKQAITQGIPNGNDGRPVPRIVSVSPCFNPKGAENIEDILERFQIA